MEVGLLDEVSRRFHVDAALEGQTLALRELRSEMPAGVIDGEGRFDLQDLLQSQMLVVWQGLPLDDLRKLDTRLSDATGVVSGRLEMTQTDDPRALGSTVIEARLESDEARYGEIPLGGGVSGGGGGGGGGGEPAGIATIYLSREAMELRDGSQVRAVRAVLQPATLRVSGGRIDVRARVSPRLAPAGQEVFSGFERYTTATVNATGIQMGPITRTFRPEDKPIEGIVQMRLSATAPLPLSAAGLSTDIREWRRAGGRGELKLERSDLAAIPLFSQLFQLLNLKLTGEPEGRGEFAFRIERGIVIIERSEYKNYGSELRFFGRVEDIFRGLDSPITGLALASTSPLPEVQELQAFNDALRALQGGFLSVELNGTLNDPKISSRALSGFFGSVDRVLTGREREAQSAVPAVGDTPLDAAEDRALEDIDVRRPIPDRDRERDARPMPRDREGERGGTGGAGTLEGSTEAGGGASGRRSSGQFRSMFRGTRGIGGRSATIISHGRCGLH